jgi:hypothetical protein
MAQIALLMRQGAPQVLMAGGHGAARAPRLGGQSGQDAMLEMGQAFSRHGHPFEHISYSLLS